MPLERLVAIGGMLLMGWYLLPSLFYLVGICMVLKMYGKSSDIVWKCLVAVAQVVLAEDAAAAPKSRSSFIAAAKPIDGDITLQPVLESFVSTPTVATPMAAAVAAATPAATTPVAAAAAGTVTQTSTSGPSIAPALKKDEIPSIVASWVDSVWKLGKQP